MTFTRVKYLLSEMHSDSVKDKSMNDWQIPYENF